MKIPESAAFSFEKKAPGILERERKKNETSSRKSHVHGRWYTLRMHFTVRIPGTDHLLPPIWPFTLSGGMYARPFGPYVLYTVTMYPSVVYYNKKMLFKLLFAPLVPVR